MKRLVRTARFIAGAVAVTGALVLGALVSARRPRRTPRSPPPTDDVGPYPFLYLVIPSPETRRDN